MSLLYQLAVLLLTEKSSESDDILVNERDSECHEPVVVDSDVHEADEVSEVGLVVEIDDELDEVCEVDYDEVSEVTKSLLERE